MLSLSCFHLIALAGSSVLPNDGHVGYHSRLLLPKEVQFLQNRRDDEDPRATANGMIFMFQSLSEINRALEREREL